jgi:hypothetical protein
MDKTKLDEIIEKHKAQPVGHGYIDIIVSRKNYKDFISDLVNYEYKVRGISWWEWCEKEKENEYGLGGPKSFYYDGWFSEIPIDIDDIVLDEKTKNAVGQIVDKIEAKTISFRDETVTFKQNSWLTPAIWLDVPNDWRNTLPYEIS